MESLQWIDSLGLHGDLNKIIKNSYADIESEWGGRIDRITLVNQAKVLEAFREMRVAEEDFMRAAVTDTMTGGKRQVRRNLCPCFGGEKPW